MERNRVLWVIFSISLFLVIVLGVGLYLLRPVTEKTPAAAARVSPPSGGFDAFEYVRGRGELPPVEEPKEPEEMVIVVGEKTATPAPPGGPEAVQVAPAAPAPPVPMPAPRLAVPSAEPKAPAPPKTAPPVPRVAAPPAAAGSRAPAARAEPKTLTVREYWIQMASVSSLSRAEQIVSSLAEQGLVAMVTTRELSGKTYYRVRLGPYAARAEAEKFLEWIRSLKGFESSYVSMVSARRPSR